MTLPFRQAPCAISLLTYPHLCQIQLCATCPGCGRFDRGFRENCRMPPAAGKAAHLAGVLAGNIDQFIDELALRDETDRLSTSIDDDED